MRLEYDSSPCSKYARSLVNSIAADVGLAEESVELLLYMLDTWGKALEFNDWVKRRAGKGKLQVTETEICKAAAKIAKACDAAE